MSLIWGCVIQHWGQVGCKKECLSPITCENIWGAEIILHRNLNRHELVHKQLHTTLVAQGAFANH